MEQHIDLEDAELLGGGTFQYANPADFDGITGANIAKLCRICNYNMEYKRNAG